MAKIRPGKRAEALLERLDITTAPIRVDKVAKSLGAVIRYSPLDDELSGMVYVKDGVPIIGVNSHHHPNRQRFTIAHEIGHLELHRHIIEQEVHVDKQFRISMPTVLKRDTNASAGVERMEIEANEFGAALLMPSFLLEEMLDKQRFDIDDQGPLERVARKFRVSKQALEYRIRNLR